MPSYAMEIVAFTLAGIIYWNVAPRLVLLVLHAERLFLDFVIWSGSARLFRLSSWVNRSPLARWAAVCALPRSWIAVTLSSKWYVARTTRQTRAKKEFSAAFGIPTSPKDPSVQRLVTSTLMRLAQEVEKDEQWSREAWIDALEEGVGESRY